MKYLKLTWLVLSNRLQWQLRLPSSELRVALE
jgi:hypothetical protein